ncbi:hypothetical protein HDV02_001936 [Globomyces sp. JEL0801]|nr:hypothetical protein HDV02_001936 [Globomyces sp. JEL0801]
MNLSLLAFFVCYVYAIIHQIKDDSIRLQYELTEDKSHVIISVRALAESSKDWVGFGIQPDGEMNDMDMVLAYIEGTSEYSIGNYYISNDDEQPQKNELDAIKNAKVSVKFNYRLILVRKS